MEIVSSFLKENAPIVAPLSGSSERKQSDGVSRCFEINCPHSEELFNESIQFSSTAKRGNNPRRIHEIPRIQITAEWTRLVHNVRKTTRRGGGNVREATNEKVSWKKSVRQFSLLSFFFPFY